MSVYLKCAPCQRLLLFRKSPLGYELHAQFSITLHFHIGFFFFFFGSIRLNRILMFNSKLTMAFAF